MHTDPYTAHLIFAAAPCVAYVGSAIAHYRKPYNRALRSLGAFATIVAGAALLASCESNSYEYRDARWTVAVWFGIALLSWFTAAWIETDGGRHDGE
jgi:hypothetical protein